MKTIPPCPVCGAKRVEESTCPGCELALALDTARPEPAVVEDLPSPMEFGDYELFEQIGHGGMGVVYRARHRKLNRIVALKMLLLGQFSSAQAIERFQREAQAAAALRHPNIVAVHDIGQVEGQWFFTMELVEGRSLAAVLRDGPVSGAQATVYLRALAEATECAHRAGIVHRDLKPSNVIIDLFDQPRITDFGLAKRLDGTADLTVTGQVLGSPNYLAPELAGGHERDASPATDVFALGAILYECLTGRPPFLAPTLHETLLRIRDTEAVAPRRLNPRISKDLETICLKCLEKKAGSRYGSARELAEEIGRFQNHEPIHARAITPADRVWRWSVRNPALAVSFGLIFVLLLILAIGSPIAAYRINRARKAEGEARSIAQT